MFHSQLRSGFTYIELMVVMVIMGITVLIAVPAFNHWFPNLRFRDASSNLFYDIELAKMTAIKKNANVVVLFDKKSCPGAPPAIPADGGGYTIFVDDGAGGGTADNDSRDGSEEIIRDIEMPEDVAICGTTFTGDKIAFLPTGLPKNGNNGKVDVNNTNSRAAEISVNLAGNAKFN